MSPSDIAGLVSFLLGVAVGWALRGGPKPIVRVRVGDIEISAENEWTVAALLKKVRKP